MFIRGYGKKYSRVLFFFFFSYTIKCVCVFGKIAFFLLNLIGVCNLMGKMINKKILMDCLWEKNLFIRVKFLLFVWMEYKIICVCVCAIQSISFLLLTNSVSHGHAKIDDGIRLMS